MIEKLEDKNMVINYLEKVKIDRLVALNINEGLDYWKLNKPDFLVLSDHQKNRDFIFEIRRQEFDHHTYILLIENENSRINHALNEMDVDDYVESPLNEKEFSRRMYRAMRSVSMVEQNLIIFALTRVFEARDKGATGHLFRVGTLSKILLDGLKENPRYKDQITESFKLDLIASCQLHDLGKMGIEDIILKKPGQYTKEEFAVMKEHVIIGYDIVKSIQQKFPHARFLDMALDITRHHHEKFDGTGYPDGLKGQDIPLSARIVGLADFYDALTSKRVYKRKYSHDEAKKLILDHKGKHFDPDLVDVFIKKEMSFKKISEEHGDQ